MAILIITNKTDVTVDFVIKKLQDQGISYYRFNTEDLFQHVSFTFDFNYNRFWLYDDIKKIEYSVHDFTAVYYRRPKLPEYDSDEQLTDGEQRFLKTEAYYTLEGFYKLLSDKFWISPVFSIREAENKFYQLLIAQKIGFKIPPSIATNMPSEFRNFMNRYSHCIIKPVYCGRIQDSKSPQIIYTSTLKKPADELSIRCSTAYIQQKIDKEYDVRVTVVGGRIFAVAIYSQELDETETDWRRGEHILKHERIELPREVSSKCFELLALLKLNYGAIDLIKTKNGEYYFLEINPNGQWAWIERQTGFDISGAIVDLLSRNEN